MINEILRIIEQKRRISLSDLSVLTKQNTEALELLMEQLVRKELVVKEEIECKGCLKSCSSCLSRGDFIVYYLPSDE